MLCLLRIIIKFLGSRLRPSALARYEPTLFDDTISPMSRHRGYHSTYNDFVKSKLDKIDINSSPEDLQIEVKQLQRNLNVLQSKGLPLYPNQGATQELWERFYNKLD